MENLVQMRAVAGFKKSISLYDLMTKKTTLNIGPTKAVTKQVKELTHENPV